MSDQEQFHECDGAPGYCVSNHGRVMNVQSRKILRSAPNAKGYHVVTLRVNGRTVSRYVHDLVGRAFSPGFRKGLTVNHRDRRRDNNRVDNLEWIESQDNSGHGRISRDNIRKVVLLARKGVPPGKIAAAVGVRVGVVQLIMRDHA